MLYDVICTYIYIYTQNISNYYTPVTNIAMENGPFEDVFPIETGDIPLLC